MEYAISQLSVLPTTKDQQTLFVAMAKAEILDGVFDAKELLYRKKMIEDTLEQIFKDDQVKKCLMEEINKYGKDGAAYGSSKITIGSKRTYDYSQTGDIEIEELTRQKEELDIKIKARQKFLQNLNKPVADPDTGELIYPAAFTSVEFFTIKL